MTCFLLFISGYVLGVLSVLLFLFFWKFQKEEFELFDVENDLHLLHLTGDCKKTYLDCPYCKEENS